MSVPIPPIANIDDVLATPEHVDRNGPRGPFEATFGRIGRVLGARQLGVNVTVVAPGKCAWPRHYHYATEEMFVVLEGAGTLRYGDAHYPLRAGDVVSILAGTGVPFQLRNTSDAPLKYLAISAENDPDVTVYPDSGKLGFFASGGPAREGGPHADGVVRIISANHSMGYWEGEE